MSTAWVVLGESHQHEPKATSPEKVDEWLPRVHIVISNFKSFLADTLHGVSHQYLQEYIDEFVFRLIQLRSMLDYENYC